MMSCAGVTLPDPSRDALSWAQRHLDYRTLALWDDLPGTPSRPLQALPVRAWDPWPVRGPQSLPSRPWLREGPLRLNTLLWPSGASRWGVFHALVDDVAMNAIRGATGSFGQPLVIDDGTGPVLSVAMYPLPPRPLSQDASGEGFQLLTLVDRRAYWPWTAAEIDVVDGTTSWADLFGYLAGALDIDLAVDDVPAAYLSPPAALSGAYDSLPALLDAACLSCGLRFAAALDGTSYRCWSAAAARTQLAANLAGVTNPRVAGGIFLQGTDLNGILPAAVQVVFPRADDGVPNPAPVTVPVTLASLNLPSNPPGGPAIGGIGGLTKTFHSSAVATHSAGSATNSADLSALATQAATDFYAWQTAGSHDVAFAGVTPWLPTGLDGLCEYAHAPDGGAGGGILSRFRRETYLDWQEALWHYTATPPAAIPSRVRVTGTTLTDACLYPAELVTRSGCTDVAVDPPVTAWLRLDGGTPAVGDAPLASPEGVRAADGLPVYVARAGGGSAPAFSGAKLVASGLQLVADNTNGVYATWAAGAYDTGGYFSSGTPTRLTVPAAGYYRVSAKGAWIFGTSDPIPAGVLFISLWKNRTVNYGGEEQDRGAQTTGLASFYSRQVCLQFTEVVLLAAGDYLEVGLFHQTGAAASWPGGNSNSFFQIEKVG